MTGAYLPELIINEQEEEELKEEGHALDNLTSEEEELPVKPPVVVPIPQEKIFKRKALKVKPVIDDTLSPVSQKVEFLVNDPVKTNESQSEEELEEVKPIEEPTEPVNIVLEEKAQVKKPKQKRNISQKQLDALARGRANSLAKRKAKATIKKEITFTEEPPLKEIAKSEHTIIKKSVGKNEMEDAIQNAILTYDNLRKQRKKEKKELEKKNQVDQRLVQQINRAMDPSNPDYWSSCFNIT